MSSNVAEVATAAIVLVLGLGVMTILLGADASTITGLMSGAIEMIIYAFIVAIFGVVVLRLVN